MLLRPRSPLRPPDLVQARLIVDETAPEPVVELETGLRMLLSEARREYVVEWAEEELAIGRPGLSAFERRTGSVEEG